MFYVVAGFVGGLVCLGLFVFSVDVFFDCVIDGFFVICKFGFCVLLEFACCYFGLLYGVLSFWVWCLRVFGF